MPTFTSRTVNVSSHTLHTSLTLEEIRSALADHRPGASRSSGWGATHDEGTRLDRGGSVGSGRPAIEEADRYLPQRLTARFFSWRYDEIVEGGERAENNWILEAVDIEVSGSGESTYLVLYSTMSADLVDLPSGRVAVSLLHAVDSADERKADLSEATALNFSGPDVFLWLAQRAASKTELAGGVQIVTLGKVDAEEDARRFRRSTLSGNVDMQRITFLNAVAQGSPLGPAVVTISQPNVDGRVERVEARLWRNGSFGPLMTNTIFRDIPDSDDARREAVHRYAYQYIPLINAAYVDDGKWGESERDALVIDKQLELSTYYGDLARKHPRWAEYEAGTLGAEEPEE